MGVEALNDWVTKTLGDKAISQKAMAELDAEEQRFQERRAAIAGILGHTATAPESGEVAPTRNSSQGSRRGKSS